LPHAAFKIAVFALLAVNTAIYVASGSLSEALDSIAWLTLLLLFELETGNFAFRHGHRATAALRALRLMASAALVLALAGYVGEREWIDALNVALWCAVVGLLELEVRRPETVGRHRAAFVATAAGLYGGLAAVVGIWLWLGEWFDAYDALLWLVAFATLEMNVIGFIARKNRAK
jgi:hypothetical protein